MYQLWRGYVPTVERLCTNCGEAMYQLWRGYVPTVERLCTNVYISDLPPTGSLKFGYADDWTLATQSKTFSHLQSTLSLDIGHLNEYFDYWKLRLHSKTCIHLDNKQAARKVKVTLAGDVLVHDFAPIYLGVTRDRSLT